MDGAYNTKPANPLKPVMDSVFRSGGLTAAVSIGFGLLVGLSYLVFPPAIFFTLLGICMMLTLSVLNMEAVFHIFLLVFILEYVNVYFTLWHTRMIFFPFNFMAIFLGVGYMISRTVKRIDKRAATPIDGILLFLVFYQFISSIWAPDSSLCVYLGLMLLCNYFMFYIPGAVIRSEAVLRRVVFVLIIAGLITATGIIVSQWEQRHMIINLTEKVSLYLGFILAASRPAGLAYVDVVAGFASIGIFLSLASAYSARSWGAKSMYIFFTLYMLYSVILTTSRGAFIGLLGGFVFFVYMNPYTKGRVIKYSVLMGLVAIMVVLVAKPGFIDRILIGFGYKGTLYFSDFSSMQTGGSHTSAGVGGLSQRYEWWKEGFAKMQAKPLTFLFGLGLGGFFHYIGNLEHSIPLAFFFEMGLVGVLLYSAIFIVTATHVYRLLKKHRMTYAHNMLLAAVTAYIAVIVINGLIYYDLISRFFWFPLGFMLAIMNLINTEEADAPPETGK